MAQQLPQTTTTLAPSPTVSRIPVTISVLSDIATLPSPVECSDATNPAVPLGRLRSAMRNPAYTQMIPFFDAFLIFYSDEHLVCIGLFLCNAICLMCFIAFYLIFMSYIFILISKKYVKTS